jgi:hypothetical protein
VSTKCCAAMGSTVTLLFTDIEGSTRLLYFMAPAAGACSGTTAGSLLQLLLSPGIEVHTHGDTSSTPLPRRRHRCVET